MKRILSQYGLETLNKNKIAISTAWDYHITLKKLLTIFKDNNLTNIEVGFHYRKEQIKQLKKLKKEYSINIISLHNFCPFPLDNYEGFPSPDIFSLSSEDKEEREQALKFTLNTIETAAELSARYVILHLGKVAIADKTNKLAELKKEKRKDFSLAKDNFLKLRNKIAKKNIEASKFSLEHLLKKAEKYDIKLALETRYYLAEFPELHEFEEILKEFEHPALGYWHDTGHAGVREFLEIYKQNDYLNKLNSYLFGIHLHDILEMDDHLPPGRGKIDFSIFKPYLDKELIIEVHQPATIDEVKKSLEYLNTVFFQKGRESYLFF